MRTEPISGAEQARIIHRLAEHGTWNGSRGGAVVRIVRYRSSSHQQIQYSVTKGHRTISGPAPTVGAAVAECNQLIVGGFPRPRPEANPELLGGLQ